MRLAIVNYDWDPRVAAPAALIDRDPRLAGWAGALRGAGCDPVVACQRFTRRADITRGGIVYRFRPDGGRPRPGLTFADAGRLHGSAAAARPDVVHVNGVLHPALVRKLREKLPKHAAIVVQDHGLDPAALPAARRNTVRRGLAAADLLLVGSHAEAVAWRASGLVPARLPVADLPEASTTMAPIGRDEARLQSGVEGAPAILWVGGLTGANDPLAVVRGFALVAGRFPTARLSMVYDAADLEDLVRAEIGRTPVLEARVRLVGAVPADRLSAYYSAADLFVRGGRTPEEDAGLLQAMACGAVPVLADIPPFRSLSGSERVGALWKPGQPGACAAAVARVVARPLATEREATRARFDRYFSWNAIGWRASDLYGRAIARRRAQPAQTSANL